MAFGIHLKATTRKDVSMLHCGRNPTKNSSLAIKCFYLKATGRFVVKRRLEVTSLI